MALGPNDGSGRVWAEVTLTELTSAYLDTPNKDDIDITLEMAHRLKELDKRLSTWNVAEASEYVGGVMRRMDARGKSTDALANVAWIRLVLMTLEEIAMGSSDE